MPPTGGPALATATTTDAPATTTTRARAPTPITRLTPPAGGQGRLALDGQVVGGLTARYAEWRAGGGRLVATGEGPWSDTTAVFQLDPDGRAVAPVDLTTGVRVVGLPVATVRSQVADWDGSAPVPLPTVVRTDQTLRISGGTVDVAPGLTSSVVEDATAITLPASLAAMSEPDAVTAGVRDLLGALLGADLSHLELRTGDTGAAAAVVTGDVGLVPPDALPPTSPTQAGALDALARAWLAHQQGAVDVTAPRADPTPHAPADTASPAATPTLPTAPAPDAGDTTGAGPTPAAGPDASPDEAAAPAAGPDAVTDAGAPPDGPETAASDTGAAPAAQPVELLMPPAPAAPGPAQVQRMAVVGGAAHRAAGAARDLPPADATTAAARGAVDEPTAEANARAAADLATALGGAPPPSPEIVALCEQIRTAIRERRPADEDELTKADIQGAARQAGGTLNTAVQGDTNRVAQSYDGLQSTPTGSPSTGTPVTPPPPAVADPGIAATTAAPDPIPPENLSLDADHDRVETMADQSRIERHSTEPLANTPPYSDVRAGRDELTGMAAQAPVDLAAQQQAAIVQAQGDMANLQRQALASLNAARGGTVRGVADRQGGMVGHETQTRESVSAQAQAIFTETQTQVQHLLEPLSRTAMARWDAEVERLSREFRSHLDEVQRWIDDRHSGASGFVVGLWDAVTGLPGWVTREYDDAEARFGDGVCNVLLSISADVSSVISAAQALIQQARDRTHELFTNLPADLQEWAAGEEQRFAAQLDGLSQQAEAARTSFVDEISHKALTAVGDVQRQVEELRQKAGGLIGRIVAAIEAFIDDPIRAIINGLLSLVGIPPASFWALIDKIAQVIDQIADDPETFANNLVEALRMGFQGFFDRFGEHLAAAFWQWLFSRCQNVGVTLPRDASLGSIIKFILSIMGITWPRIRQILVRQVGERNVAIIEKVWELVSLLIERGPDGIWEMLKEKLSPEAIVEAVVQAAVEFAVQALIERVALRLLGMLNPAGAVLQAIMLIYTVLKWVFENAARIFALVETVVNACADIMAGSLAAVAQMIENALAMLLPLVIDLLAGMIGLGDLPDQVAAAIGRLQAMVLPVVESVIVALVTRGRALLASLGLGGGAAGEGGGDDELGTTVRFSAGGEGHRIWVQAGPSPVVMMASAASPIASKVGEWRGRVARMAASDPKKAQASGLLDQLGPLIEQSNTEATTIKHEMDSAHAQPAAGGGGAPGGSAAAPTLPSDDALEDHERQIADLVVQLYVLLEPDLAAIAAHLADVLPAKADQRVTELVARWAEGLSGIQAGPVDNRQNLIANPAAALAGTTGADGAAVIGSTSNLHALAGYFITAAGERSDDTAAFFQYVFVTRSPDPPHVVRPDFTTAVGQAAAQRIEDYVKANLAGLALSDEERTAITNELDVGFRMGTDVGTFTGLRSREPDHAWFKPRAIPVQSDGALTYETVSGQTFTVEETREGLPTRVVGENLTMFSGRGVTQDSPYFVKNQDFNRAHVIANEFGGSGYRSGHNLVTTSSYYNQTVMRGAEVEIGSFVDRQAGAADARVRATMPPQAAVVRFSLAVALKYIDALIRLIADAIARNPNLKDKHETVRAEIMKKLSDANIDKRLQRVKETKYDLSDLIVAGEGREGMSTEIGEDEWLLRESP